MTQIIESNCSSNIDIEMSRFTRIFSFRKRTTQGSPSATNRLISITNPRFESFGDILRSKRTTEYHLRQQPRTIDEALVDITSSAETDISSLVDKSKGTTEFFHKSSVS